MIHFHTMLVLLMKLLLLISTTRNAFNYIIFLILKSIPGLSYECVYGTVTRNATVNNDNTVTCNNNPVVSNNRE